jgi:hypothetical protein
MAENSSQTGQTKKVTLPSSIEQVMWSKKLAAVGGVVGLEVYMLYIGNNSEIQIELSDKSGKTLGKYSEHTAGNRFWAQIRVPMDAREELYAMVKLPKHSLQKKSSPLVVVPPVQISNAKWDKSEARRGDTLKLTADVKGVPDGVEAMIEVYEHDSDGAHELVSKFQVPVKNKKIDAEWKFEYHEDTGSIPSAHETEKGYHAPKYFFKATVGEVGVDSAALEFKDGIALELNDDSGNPISDVEYVLHCADGSQRKGKMDNEGKAFEKDVPPGPVTVEFVDKKK